MQPVLRAARWVKILSMTSGVSMHAMTRSAATHATVFDVDVERLA